MFKNITLPSYKVYDALREASHHPGQVVWTNVDQTF